MESVTQAGLSFRDVIVVQKSYSKVYVAFVSY